MNNIISITQFNEIVKGIKAMKADFVCVTENMLYGTDNTFSSLKTYQMDMNIPISPFTIITKTLSSEFYNNITDTNIIIDFDTGKIYCPNNTSYAEQSQQMIDNQLSMKILGIANKIFPSMEISKCIDYGDITDDMNFQRFKSIKSAEGADLYVPKGEFLYGMYLYSGAIPMVKADKISLKVYDEGNIFISNFIIYKKKLNPVNLYFKFVKLNNSR